MRLDIETDGVVRTVQISGRGRHLNVLIEGQEQLIDAVEIEPGRWSLLVEPGGASVEARVRPGRDGGWTVFLNGTSVPVTLHDPVRSRRGAHAKRGAGGRIATSDSALVRIAAPMPGKVVRVLVARGVRVSARQALVVVEAMKMENELRAPRDGTVLEVFAKEGALVEAGAPLLTIA